jgi:hypothetical protein
MIAVNSRQDGLPCHFLARISYKQSHVAILRAEHSF